MAEEILNSILDWGFENTNILQAKDNEHSKSFLHFVSEKGYAPVVTKVLGQGVEIDQRDDQRRTALHWATKSGQTDVARLLIQNGANVNANCQDEEMTPLHVASIHGKLEIAEFFMTSVGLP